MVKNYDFVELRRILDVAEAELPMKTVFAIEISDAKNLLVPEFNSKSIELELGFRFKYMGFDCILVADDIPCSICERKYGSHKLSCPNNPYNHRPLIHLDL